MPTGRFRQARISRRLDINEHGVVVASSDPNEISSLPRRSQPPKPMMKKTLVFLTTLTLLTAITVRAR